VAGTGPYVIRRLSFPNVDLASVQALDWGHTCTITRATCGCTLTGSARPARIPRLIAGARVGSGRGRSPPLAGLAGDLGRPLLLVRQGTGTPSLTGLRGQLLSRIRSCTGFRALLPSLSSSRSSLLVPNAPAPTSGWTWPSRSTRATRALDVRPGPRPRSLPRSCSSRRCLLSAARRRSTRCPSADEHKDWPAAGAR
jgi:hypothetical protein